MNCFSIEHCLHIRIHLSNSCGTFLSVTGASRGYAFVEYETEREMRRAYKVLQHISSLKYDIFFSPTTDLCFPFWLVPK